MDMTLLIVEKHEWRWRRNLIMLQRCKQPQGEAKSHAQQPSHKNSWAPDITAPELDISQSLSEQMKSVQQGIKPSCVYHRTEQQDY